MNVPYAEVIGNPVGQSRSPLIHKHWLAELGLEGDYRTHTLDEERLGDYFAASRDNPEWRGCNVTMPLKQAVLPHLDRIEPLARRMGAVNTVHRAEDGALVGRNTDGVGFLEPLRKRLQEQHYFRMARIIGTGGAARAIAVVLAQEGMVLVVAGRTREKAQAVIDAIAPDGEHHAVELAQFEQPTDFAFDDREGCLDLVVNTTPLGMRGQPQVPFDWSHAPPGAIAYDIVTDPPDTAFLQRAREAGHETVDGLAMLIGQAAAAFPRFYGVEPPRENDAALRMTLAA